MPFTGLVMQPHEMEVVQDVFKAVVAEPWFSRTVENEKAFAASVLRAYRTGITDRDRLLVNCREAAKLQFSGHT